VISSKNQRTWGASGLLLSFGILICTAMSGIAETPKADTARKTTVEFDRDVRPILSENCFACHGFDENKRAAGLRLDTSDGITAKLPSGNVAVVPGKPNAGTLMQRVNAHGTLQMPPASSGKVITAKQKDILRTWIAQGAKWSGHWAFTAPKRPEIPKTKTQSWARNPIDSFLLARMEQEGLTPSPQADRAILLRRLSLDLTGLPPTLKEIQDFVADKSPDAYEKQVDRLLASPHYGERMALKWLDVARYADTHGFHIDSHRDMWRWRDWVIDAFNQNLSYDKFIEWQIAGDLLPNATLEQKIATGFNRNHPINFEGGAIPEEYQTAYVIDRVATTSTAFLGLTMQCAQCHSHKYDPLTNKEYYQFYAFFNTIKENGLDGTTGNAQPFIKAPLPGQMEQLQEYGKQVAASETTQKARFAQIQASRAEWEPKLAAEQTKGEVSAGLAAWIKFEETSGEALTVDGTAGAGGTVRGKANWQKGKSGGALKLEGETWAELGSKPSFDSSDKFSYGAWVNPIDNRHQTILSKIDNDNGIRGWDVYLGDGKIYVHLISKWENDAIRLNSKQTIPMNQWTHVFVTYDGSKKAKGVRVYVNGKAIETETTHDTLTGTIANEQPIRVGRRSGGATFQGMIDEVRLYGRELTTAEVGQLVANDALRPLLAVASEKRTPEQQAALVTYYAENHDAEYKKVSSELASWRQKYADFDKAIPTTMIMEEQEKPRTTHILLRGQYDQFGEKVTTGVPAFLPSLPKSDKSANRLALAHWMTDPKNPLVSRVAVNRIWQTIFGTGIVKTVEDFGTQGERPSHPELLDWLATEFIRTDWDVKKLVRLIVTSAAYRQTSQATKEQIERDPENRLLARAPRSRLSAEFVRDLALSASGLLVPKIGGESVKPYHPAGLWEEMAFGGGFTAQTYVQDHGEKLYRRSMYTFWKRTVPPPSLTTLDAPEREFCVVRRSVTNTPLQALVLMNDPTYVEASRKFAERIMTEGGLSTPARLRFAWETATSRPIRAKEIQILTRLFNRQMERFRKDNDAAVKLLSVGESPRNAKLNATELAAWAAVAGTILNLDETITKS
jgi:hypothetical protein